MMNKLTLIPSRANSIFLKFILFFVTGFYIVSASSAIYLNFYARNKYFEHWPYLLIVPFGAIVIGYILKTAIKRIEFSDSQISLERLLGKDIFYYTDIERVDLKRGVSSQYIHYEIRIRNQRKKVVPLVRKLSQHGPPALLFQVENQFSSTYGGDSFENVNDESKAVEALVAKVNQAFRDSGVEVHE